MICQLIEESRNPDATTLPILRASELLGISRAGYYKRQLRIDEPIIPPSIDMMLKDELQKIAIEFPRYGYRRMTKELHRRGYPVNAKRILRLMREDNLLCLKRIFTPITTDSNHGMRVYPNLIKDLEITQLNQAWVSDITYIRLLEEFVYLAVIIDLFSRRCIGWQLGRSINTELVISALKRALENRAGQDLAGLIHHSDQGVQYASADYVRLLVQNKIEISMSQKGNPYDNAFAESFIKTLKWEEVYLKEYESFQDAYFNISKFIEEVYNRKRLHSSIGYKPPIEFEAEVALNTLA